MPADRYLELLKSSLTNELHAELEAQLLFSVLCAAQNLVMPLPDFRAIRSDRDLLASILQAKSDGDPFLLELDSTEGQRYVDENLKNDTQFGHTLVGRKRLDHLQSCVESVIDQDVPGDLVEAGVWRGGCCILMRAVLAARNCTDRCVWVCDSFQGVPESRHAIDSGYAMDRRHLPVLAVSEDAVRDLFDRYGLLDDQVRFVPGWFQHSLAAAPVKRIAVLRLDADLYQSTHEALECLYPRVSAGGWVIVDDYYSLPPCRRAVDEYRAAHGIDDPLRTVDDHSVCWQVS